MLAGLSAGLLLTGVAELLVDGWSWVRLTHVLSGVVLLGVAPWPRLIRPTVALVGAVCVFQYVREVIPGGHNDQFDPSSDPTLILNGFILAGLMVALMWPWRVQRS